MPEIFTEENKHYYQHGLFQDKASLSSEEVLEYRKYYVNNIANVVYNKYLEDHKNDKKLLGKATFLKILRGDVRPTSIYLTIPVYKKSIKRW